ncbi:pre-rRNA 2'-O-ribose RNA methyltransferase FTSJ3-like [Penaeus monodon]|uniref:pre-rRNA 2'-O-ribose RNA methyltransferase FTSJ3-like n=1 Tax=Penaeus monodon TaxID=6687 RepID=UPI0018A733C8|nr:pre-rRNA 2'-O-ribose RNA methyltransferase FTSJ3-like [Penaeus monodon]
MGKRVKPGTRDIYYGRAKCAGYRARSAYKLIQLNTKYQFLQKSRVCIDLCAAPGSWMQVAKKYMPVSSFIIGVDRNRIDSIYGCLSIQGDITTEKTRSELRGALKTWKADVVLHDGAPNMGKNWIYDAYTQNLLVLHAFKLATEFLNKGGYFVSKVFRSKDYFKLEYVFKKFFKKVEATKPDASRYESAEIFVVCQGFLAPDKVDPEFFSAQHVFNELDLEPKPKINLLRTKKTRDKAEGYEEGATIVHKKVPVSQFIHAENFMEVLADAWELEFDEEKAKQHPQTTEEILEYCKDIKVLGRKEIKKLLAWRKKLADEYTKAQEAKKKEQEQVQEAQKTPEELKQEELQKIDQQIAEMELLAAHEQKKVLKKRQKLLQKQLQRLRLKTLIPGDQGPIDESEKHVFSLSRLGEMRSVDDVVDVSADSVPVEEEAAQEKRPKYRMVRPGEEELDETGRYYVNPKDIAVEEEEMEDEGLGLKADPVARPPADVEDLKTDEDNPLLTDLVGDQEEAKRIRKAEMWFNQDIFNDVENEVDDDVGVELAIREYESRGGELYKQKEAKEKKRDRKGKTKGSSSDSDSDSDSSTDSEEEVFTDAEDPDDDAQPKAKKAKANKENQQPQVGPHLAAGAAIREKDREIPLDPEGLAFATKMIHSKKAKRDIVDAGWNRNMYGDEDLPEWFMASENKYNNKPVEVDPADLRMYRDREKAVNARTLKKVVEAKARKHRKVKKHMEKARKKAESIATNAEMTQREKVSQVKKLYKAAMRPLEKKERTYIVMKKTNQGRKPRGAGKGPYKLVDKRLKKDIKGKMRSESKKGKMKRTPKKKARK